jgi:hypothetical protein
MSRDELRQAAIDCLANAFKGESLKGGPDGADVPSHVVQAAVAIVLTPDESKP